MLQESNDGLALARQTTQQAVVERLRKLILSHQLLPGQRLVESELAKQFGVSRTPIREALHKLSHEGLVAFSSYKGASVAKLSSADLEEIYAVRIALESYATYLAAQRITEEELEQLRLILRQMEHEFQHGDSARLVQFHHQFHAAIYSAAKQRRLYDLTLQYLALADVYQRMALSLGRGARDPIIEHQQILVVLQQRDADAACRLMRVHLEQTVAELLDLFKPEQDRPG